MKKAKKRVSKIAKGRLARYLVFKGTKEKTQSGLTKDDLVRSKSGKIVSRKKSALGKKFDRVKGWRESVMKARAVMGIRHVPEHGQLRRVPPGSICIQFVVAIRGSRPSKSRFPQSRASSRFRPILDRSILSST